MDSLSQIALGAAVGLAVMGRRTALWKSALWGGIVGTLPDLDALIDHGDAVRNMTLHRAESHALFWQTLVSPLLALAIARVQGELAQWRRWWLAVWLALVTHALLDWMTVYGTQLGLPLTDRPFGVGSVFIIDPLYTLPLLVGVGVALRGRATALRWNALGLALSTAYLAWGVGAQQHVRAIAQESLRREGVAVQQLLVTPTAFNTLLWRVVAMSPDGYREGFHSLLDAERRITFDRFDRGAALTPALAGNWAGERVAWFSRGFYRLAEDGGALVITDLRMGQEPDYAFSFVVARRGSDWQAVTPVGVGGLLGQGDARPMLRWLARRALGEALPPPR